MTFGLRESRKIPGSGFEQLEYSISSIGCLKETANRHTNKAFSSRIANKLTSILLPIGYPNSVADEYMQYQLWDTIQELLGYFARLITAHANLISIGVGNAEASVLSVLTLNVFSNLISTLLGLFISAKYCAIFGANMKVFWIWNEMTSIVAGLLMLYASAHRNLFMYLLIVSGIISTIGSVPGGIARAGLAPHLARKQNFSDVAAKEGNQNRMGKVLMIFIAYPFIKFIGNDFKYAWTSYLVLTAVKMYCVISAVEILQLKSINHQRMDAILHLWTNNDGGKIDISPKAISRIETKSIFSVLHFFGVQIFGNEQNCCHIYFGKSLKSLQLENGQVFGGWGKCIKMYANEKYMLVFDNERMNVCNVLLSEEAQNTDRIQAYYHAYVAHQQKSVDHIHNIHQNATLMIEEMMSVGWNMNCVKFASEGWTCDWKNMKQK